MSLSCVFLMENYNFSEVGEFVNIGVGEDVTISELVELIKEIVGFEGEINYDTSKPGRPRIDIVYTTAGMRDAFPDKIKMIDSAVKLASSLPGVNYPNYVNQSSLTLYDSLISEGYDNETATKLSTMRCFAVMDGTYDIGVSDAISASGSWSTLPSVFKSSTMVSPIPLGR